MISIEHVSKSFRKIPFRHHITLKGNLISQLKKMGRYLKNSDDPSYKEESPLPQSYQVLDDISCIIAEAQTVAFIGKNGCGKSTLLKLLAGIYWPDKGDVRIDGRISSLIELGAGFHPEFSGRENVFVNGQILGLSKDQLKKKFDEIVHFSGIENFIDMPVRTYSSGMFVRLAFSVAVHVDPDVLLIDEVMAVGDANFQQKCIQKMTEFKRAGKTIIIVTHSLNLVESWADRALYLKDAKIVYDGAPKQGIQMYLNDVNEKDPDPSNDTTVKQELTLSERLVQTYLDPQFKVMDAQSSEDSFSVVLKKSSKLQNILVRLLTQDGSIILSEGDMPQYLNDDTCRITWSTNLLMPMHYRLAVLERSKDAHSNVLQLNFEVVTKADAGDVGGFIRMHEITETAQGFNA